MTLSRRAARASLAIALPLLATGCVARDPHAPYFATVPYQPFSRQAAIAIALDEWRLFGSPVDDDPPGQRRLPMPDRKPERAPGLWQRVGEYWYEGMNPDRVESRWTGKHDQDGRVFPASVDGDYAWSAAFISYVMRIAGAGAAFPYAPDHATYIDIARRMTDGTAQGWAVFAERPAAYAPVPGDLVCLGRERAAGITYNDLPAPVFPAHCDLVVAAAAGALTVVGGNVDDAVTMKHVPIGADGRLAGPAGVLDTRYRWFVVLRIVYAQ